MVFEIKYWSWSYKIGQSGYAMSCLFLYTKSSFNALWPTTNRCPPKFFLLLLQTWSSWMLLLACSSLFYCCCKLVLATCLCTKFGHALSESQKRKTALQKTIKTSNQFLWYVKLTDKRIFKIGLAINSCFIHPYFGNVLTLGFPYTLHTCFSIAETLKS